MAETNGVFYLDLTPTQDTSGKYRFCSGFPKKNCVILLVTVAVWRDNPRYCTNTSLTGAKQGVGRWVLPSRI